MQDNYFIFRTMIFLGCYRVLLPTFTYCGQKMYHIKSKGVNISI